MSIYQENIAKRIQPTSFSDSNLDLLKKRLPNKFILNIYGLAGVGKGTVSKLLGEKLDILHFDSGLIHRALTYIYLTQGIECTPENIKSKMQELTFNLTKESGLEIFWKGQKIPIASLRDPKISSTVARFASLDFEQNVFFELMYEIFSKQPQPLVLDGRGSKPPHLVKLSNEGFKIVKILLEVSDDTNFQRYYMSYMIKNNMRELTEEEKDSVYQEFQNSILKRNNDDLLWMQRMGIGIISSDSGILDTSSLSPDDVVESCLAYISSEIELQ